MNYEEHSEALVEDRVPEGAVREHRLDRSYVCDLIELLTAHPNGLRRWSVMRALRKARENAGRDVPQKFEDDVERAFRRFCANSDAANAPDRLPGSVLFYRPPERAGEVWAVFPGKTETWLKTNLIERGR
ncbi:MAG: hypothetical protein WCA78_10250 [Rhizomicrobium sp.]